MVSIMSVAIKLANAKQVLGENLRYDGSCPICSGIVTLEDAGDSFKVTCSNQCDPVVVLEQLGFSKGDFQRKRKAKPRDVTSQIFCGEGSHLGLLPHHYKHLQASGLRDETIKAAGIHSETRIQRVAMMLGWRTAPKKMCPAIVFPFVSRNGPSEYYRLRPDSPRLDRNKKPIKYESPKGLPNRPYFPPGTLAAVAEAKRELLFTEGEKKALAADQLGFPCIGLVGVYGWKEKSHERMILELEQIDLTDRPVLIAFDSDLSTNSDVQQAEEKLAKHLADRGAIVRCIRLPDGPPGQDGSPTKQGLDDFLVAQGSEAARALRALIDNAIEPEVLEGSFQKEDAKEADPADEAGLFLACNQHEDKECRLRYWRGGFWWWSRGRYMPLQPSEVRGNLILHVNQSYYGLTTSITNNIMDQVKAQSMLSCSYEPPCWIGGPPEGWLPEDSLVTASGIVQLRKLVDEQNDYLHPPTPRFFTPTALNFDFDLNAPAPENWLKFLKALWPADDASIQLLQEWFGYCLTPDTRLQKMLLLIGPPRCGKGTIARVLTAMVGKENVAGPTLAGLQNDFGLAPLVGKTLAIVADARLGGKADQHMITERLLSISGEDLLTINRKYQEQLTMKLLCRFMILSNELPRLADASGALANRFLLLRFSQTFLGKEDQTLTDRLLDERQGILLWAIQGWKRLRERKHFLQPESGEDLREQLNDLSSQTGAFVRERCIVAPGGRVDVSDIYSAWCRWCEQRGRNRPGSEQTFGRDLHAAVPTIKSVRPKENGERYRAYEGITLRTE